MTTLNTIIEEEKGEALKINKEFEDSIIYDITAGNHDENWLMAKIVDLLTTAIQRAYEAGQSERQARIRESFNEWFKNSTEDVEDWADRVIK